MKLEILFTAPPPPLCILIDVDLIGIFLYKREKCLVAATSVLSKQYRQFPMRVHTYISPNLINFLKKFASKLLLV